MIYLVGILVLITSVYIYSIIWVIVGFIKIKQKDKKESINKIEKRISVIIPARNEEKNILLCLQTLRDQNYDSSNFEVIVVNDYSTDNTYDVVNEFIKSNDITLRIYNLKDEISKKSALKYGIKKSKFEIIATTDADCIVPRNWLANISHQFSNEISMIIGPIMFKKHKGFLSAFQSLDMLAIQGIEFGALHYGEPILNNAANLSYLKQTFNNLGGFDTFNTPSGDDIFLLERFKTAYKVKGYLHKDFIVETNSESTFTSFFHQRLRWASKAKYYTNKLLIYFSLIILIQNVSMLFIYLGMPLVEKYCLILTFLLFCKWLIDFILLFLLASFFKRKKALFYFIPVQIIYPFYIILIWFASLMIAFEWKGRKFNE